MKHRNPHAKDPWTAWTLWYVNPDDPNGEKPPEDHYVWDLWNAYAEIRQTPDEQKRVELFKTKILEVWKRELPMIGIFGDPPTIVLVKNGLKGIHGGYQFDCCSTGYEYIIDPATWYWDEPEKHA